MLNHNVARQPFLCVGLDPVVELMPQRFKSSNNPLFDFNRWIIDETAPVTEAYKPNSAFYEAYGSDGISALKQTIAYIKSTYPEKLVILDAKRGDISSTNEGYVQFVFEYLNADGITLNPYVGKEGLMPFINRHDKLLIFLAKTSNPGAGEFQDLVLNSTMPLWQHVIKQVAHDWNKEGNCAVVMGATRPKELAVARQLAGELPFLVPGIGAQGGEVEEVVRHGLNSTGGGLIISASRSIIQAADPYQAANTLALQISAATGSL